MYNSHTYIKADRREGLRGLVNLGNTCYLNAVVQALSHANIQPYLQDLAQTTNNVLIAELADLLRALWAVDRNMQTGVNPRRFKAAIDRELTQFRGYEQHDSQELLVALIDLLIEARASPAVASSYTDSFCRDVSCRPAGGAAASVTPPPLYCQVTDINSAMLQREDESKLWRTQWAVYKDRYPKSRITKLFQGFGATRIQCMVCSELNIKMEPVTAVLSLPVMTPDNQPIKSLAEAINQYLEPEVLQNDEAWFCPRCGLKRPAQKTSYTYKWPEIVIMHLKRFSWCPRRGFSKLGHPISVSRGGGGTFYAELPRKFKRNLKYELFAVINHQGSYEGGHYEAACLHKGAAAWFNFDDSVVSSIAEAKEVIASTNYLLFFRKSSDPFSALAKAALPNSRYSGPLLGAAPTPLPYNSSVSGSQSASPDLRPSSIRQHHQSLSGPQEYCSSRSTLLAPPSDSRLLHRKNATIHSPIQPPRRFRS